MDPRLPAGVCHNYLTPNLVHVARAKPSENTRHNDYSYLRDD